MASLKCANCSTLVLLVEHAVAKQIMDKLADEFGSDFLAGVADAPDMTTVHALVSAEQRDLDGDLVYCPDCVVRLIVAGVEHSY